MAVDAPPIKPSRQARELHHQMVARATRSARHGITLSLGQTLELSVERVKSGHRDQEEVHELQREGWIVPSPDGGWLLD